MKIDLLIDIIKEYNNYELVENRNKSIEDFGKWLHEKPLKKTKPNNSSDHSDVLGRDEIEVEICKLVIYMNRYARILIKKGLEKFPELVSEDFTYLYTLMGTESMTKIQLIEKNVHEKPTGLEVIKRLLKHGLINEKADINDKRSKRVFVTQKGKKVFYNSAKEMFKVSKVISGNLDEKEKNQLHKLLLKLENFHNPIYLRERDKTMNLLLEKIK